MSDKMSVHYKSDKADWGTPREFYERMNKLFGPFDFDAAASKHNAKHEIWLGPDLDYDALKMNWRNDVVSRGAKPGVITAWCNPEYGDGIGKWVEKFAIEAIENNVRTCALLPARTDTTWFHGWVFPHARLVWVRGRLKFEGAKDSAPFPSVIALFGYPYSLNTQDSWVWASAKNQAKHDLRRIQGLPEDEEVVGEPA